MACTGSVWQRVAHLSTLALGLLLSAVLWGLVRAPEQADAGAVGESVAAHQAIDAWEALWSDLAEHGVASLTPAPDPSRRAAGDTVFMRYRNLWGPIDSSARLAFQLAALSADPERKLALIAPLTQADDPLIRLRAYLEQARVQRRLQQVEAARASAEAALALPGLDEPLYADAWFIISEIAWQQGQLDGAERALSAAIAADPGFWDARRLRLDVLARQLERPRQHAPRCLDRTRHMIQDLGALPALAEDQTQFRDLADRFARQGTPNTVALALIAALGYQWSGDEPGARRMLERAAQLRGRLPGGCEQRILERIAMLEQQMPGLRP